MSAGYTEVAKPWMSFRVLRSISWETTIEGLVIRFCFFSEARRPFGETKSKYYGKQKPLGEVCGFEAAISDHY